MRNTHGVQEDDIYDEMKEVLARMDETVGRLNAAIQRRAHPDTLHSINEELKTLAYRESRIVNRAKKEIIPQRILFERARA